MRSKSKKSITISNLLWRNYIFIIITSMAMIVIPCAVLAILSQVYRGDVTTYQYTASSIMQDSINDINSEGIIKNRGSVDVIQKDLSVIHLGGKDTIGVEKFTMEELTNFFISTKSGANDYHRDIAYNKKQGFWVVVTFPISLTIKLIVQYNKISKDFNFFRLLVLTTLILYALIVLISVILYSKYTARSFIKPMHALQDMTVQIEKENFQYALESGEEFTIKEFTQYREALKHMSMELKKQQDLTEYVSDNRKNLVRDISHDLKNPLASIRGYSELYINNKTVSQQQRDNYVEIIYKNSIRAGELITSLFEYSKLDSKDFMLQRSSVDLCELLRNVVAEYIPRMEEENLLPEVNIPEEEIIVQIDSLQMKRVFSNLIDNALKYHGNGNKIISSLYKDSLLKAVVIHIKDDGIGIKEEFADTCFEPFSREDKMRNSKTGGSGLGLAIVKRIITLHGGSISLTSGENEGCDFEIHLPL